MATMDSIVFMPDYLFKEVTTEGGEAAAEDEVEFTSAMLYQEQTMRMFPREMTAKFKIMPAFDENYMREEEGRGDD